MFHASIWSVVFPKDRFFHGNRDVFRLSEGWNQVSGSWIQKKAVEAFKRPVVIFRQNCEHDGWRGCGREIGKRYVASLLCGLLWRYLAAPRKRIPRRRRAAPDIQV